MYNSFFINMNTIIQLRIYNLQETSRLTRRCPCNNDISVLVLWCTYTTIPITVPIPHTCIPHHTFIIILVLSSIFNSHISQNLSHLTCMYGPSISYLYHHSRTIFEGHGQTKIKVTTKFHYKLPLAQGGDHPKNPVSISLAVFEL